MCQEYRVARLRPALGTLAGIEARAPSRRQAERALAAGYAALGRVEALLHPGRAGSDLARLNAAVAGRRIAVHPWTAELLRLSRELCLLSAGRFEPALPACGTVLQWLPVGPRSVHVRRAAHLDLGGIAKGFAVDRAVGALKDNSVTAGIVNAGGDLRTFGSASEVVYVRHPAEPTRTAGAVRLRERAMATSGVYFERRKYRGKYVGPILDGHTGQSACELISVTVAAAECMIADALTKLVFTLRGKAAGLLAQYRADALLLERNGTPSWMFHSPCDTRDQTRFD